MFLLPVAAVQVPLNPPPLVQPQLPLNIQVFADGYTESMGAPPEPENTTALMNLEQISQDSYLFLFSSTSKTGGMCMSASISISEQGFG